MHGVIFPFAGSSAPGGFLMCDGSAVSRTTYAALFAAIGTTFGTGDGSTTFNIPDMRGRIPAGKDNMGGSAANRLTSGGSGITGTTLGAVGGAETHTLTAAQIPAISSSGTFGLSSGNLVQSNGSTTSYSTGTGGASIWQAFTNGSSQSLVSPNASGTTSSTNTGGSTHNNTQPTMVLNYIIKT